MYKNTPLPDISDIALINMAEMLINKLNPAIPDHVVFYMRLKQKEKKLNDSPS